jgi:hypothetical protein
MATLGSGDVDKEDSWVGEDETGEDPSELYLCSSKNQCCPRVGIDVAGLRMFWYLFSAILWGKVEIPGDHNFHQNQLSFWKLSVQKVQKT